MNPFINMIVPNIDITSIIDFNFNIFDFETNYGRLETLPQISKVIFTHFISNIDIYQLDNFLISVRDGYIDTNPYHNSIHGTDVCQTIALYLYNSNVINILSLSELDITAMLIAAVTHDLGHPGTTNQFQINSYSNLAVLYNDKSVLEHFHASSAFNILNQEKCNILSNYNSSDFKLIRKRIIDSILSTDMIYHTKVMSQMKNRMQSNCISFNFEEKQEVINFLIHAADISHSTKKFEISYKWTNLVSEEFWMQGDEEKKQDLPISFLCDRENTDVAKSQIGFIKGIIMPTVDLLVDFLPNLYELGQNVEENLEKWTGEIDM
jgi:hypothetical protein